MAKKKKSRINITRLNVSTKKALTISFSIILFCIVLLAITITLSQPQTTAKPKEVVPEERVILKTALNNFKCVSLKQFNQAQKELVLEKNEKEELVPSEHFSRNQKGFLSWNKVYHHN